MAEEPALLLWPTLNVALDLDTDPHAVKGVVGDVIHVRAVLTSK